MRDKYLDVIKIFNKQITEGMKTMLMEMDYLNKDIYPYNLRDPWFSYYNPNKNAKVSFLLTLPYLLTDTIPNIYEEKRVKNYLEDEMVAISVRWQNLGFHTHVNGEKRRRFHISFLKLFLFFRKLFSFQ